MNLQIRPAAPDDLPLIVDSWQKSFLDQSRSAPNGRGPLSKMRREDYFREQSKVIDRLLQHPETVVRVGCWEEDPNLIIGWVCGAPRLRLLHFLYVGGLYRREGYGKALLGSLFAQVGEEPITLTHWTRAAAFYLKRWWLQYNPFVLSELLGVEPGRGWLIHGTGEVRAIDHTSRVVIGGNHVE